MIIDIDLFSLKKITYKLMLFNFVQVRNLNNFIILVIIQNREMFTDFDDFQIYYKN